MAKKTVELMFCDESGCNGAWRPGTLEGDICVLCRKDLCKEHALQLVSSFINHDADTAFTLGAACGACSEELTVVLQGAANVINERLRGLVTDCVRDYATRLKEERIAKPKLNFVSKVPYTVAKSKH